MPDVVLLQMPYVAIQRPSIALSILKAALEREQVSCQVVYPNIWWADEIGMSTYEAVASTQNDDLVGDWIFAGAAFPDHPSEALDFFELVNLDVTRVMYGDTAAELFVRCREQAPAFIERAARRILELRPRVVGCTSMFAQNCASLAVLRKLKEIQPDLVTILGGANCDTPMGQVLHRNFGWLDYVMTGEADLSFGPFCRELLQGSQAPVPPPGMIGPGDRPLTRAITRATTFKLDEVPTPDFDDYFETLNGSPLGAHVHPGLVVESSRGCWWGQVHHCTFCGLNANGMNFRARSAEAAQAEFASVADRYGVTQFLVADNIIDTRHFKTLLPRLQADPRDYTLFYETKSNLKREQLDLLMQAGVIWIQPGFESLHDEILTLIDKGTTAAINVQTLKWSREKGMRLSWNILSGFPHEKDEWYAEMAEWVPSIIHLQPPQGVLKFRYDRYSPYHMNPDKYGVRIVPNRRYSLVYPLAAAELADLAYFFEDERDLSGPISVSGAQVEEKKQALQARTQRDFQEYYRYLMATATRRGQRGREGPGRARLTDLVEEWIRTFWQELPPILSVSDEGHRLRFYDTRPLAVSRQWECEGLARQLYLACDVARTPKWLMEELQRPWEELEAVAGQLLERRLLLPLSGRWLSIAVAGEIPAIPTANVFPGGYLSVHPRPHHPADVPWSLRPSLVR